MTGSGPVLAMLLSSTVVAGVVSVLANLWLDRGRTRESERARLRTAFAEAFDAYRQYIEFGYAIRRRRVDRPEEERVRLSEELRRIQARLGYFRAWTRLEDPASGAAFQTLLDQAREVAGTAMKQAWRDVPVASDAEMVIGRDVIDLTALHGHEDRYLQAVQDRINRLTPRSMRQRRPGPRRKATTGPELLGPPDQK